MDYSKCINEIKAKKFEDVFSVLYGKKAEVLERQYNRYAGAVEMFHKVFPEHTDIKIYSAPGRTEIGGNHTDHQGGVVLAGAVDFDVIGIVGFHNDGVIRVKSEGYALAEITLNNLTYNAKDNGTSKLVKGIVTKFKERGIAVDGFDVYTTSDVISGGGISSSAAFETLIATIIDKKYNDGKSTPFELAQCGWFAENVFFGKKCGLLDQTVSAYGGLISIDFKDENNPVIERIPFNFEMFGYSLCIVDTKSSHADLTDDYVAIREEMKQIADYFECTALSQVDEKKFYINLPDLRHFCSDRALLRAMHFFGETKRAAQEAEALKNKDMEKFLTLVSESGTSSGTLLQNLYSVNAPGDQAIPLALIISKMVLGKDGAARVHGGGFAGTIQAFVPKDMLVDYKNNIERIFGEGSCHEMRIRPVGGIEII